MLEPFIGELKIVSFNFAPREWSFCDGQLISIAQNTALFSLLGTTFGGNGTTSFGLPNMQGKSPMQPGQGPGLSLRILGETGGIENVTLLQSQMPLHNHAMKASSGFGEFNTPSNNALGISTNGAIYTTNIPNTTMNAQSVSVVGNGQPHNNMMPYVALNFVIAMQGVYPPRS
jgi:microcystin-dependent protein